MFYTERITIYKEKKSTIMNVFLRAIAGIVVICGFFFLLAQGLNYLQKPNALDNVEKRLDEAAEKESVLTDNEKKLKQEAQSKEWDDLDKQTDK
jgi:large-conductance mechanosensitive channel